MSPRPGGEADKFGNRYEGVWTVRQLLDVLAGRIDSITVEEPRELGEGVEFTLRRGSITEVHQVKRQLGSANGWTLHSLHSKGVLDKARDHVAAGRQFHFISTIPAPELNELTDRARRSADLQAFVGGMLDSKKLQPDFDYLSSTVYGSAQVAWETLRGTWAYWPDERVTRDVNATLAGLLLEGAESPLLAAVGLGDLVLNNLAVRLDATAIDSRLGEYGLRRARLSGSQTMVRAVQAVTDNWKASVERELLRPTIPRSEASDIVDRLKGEDRLLFAVGAAGGGKSAVLHEAVTQLESEDWTVLALRLDRIIEPISSAMQLGRWLDLGAPPVTGLGAAAQDRPSLLVIDQLDAVSLASGRMPATFDAVAQLIREASAFPDMRVLLACRKFDVDNDSRIRALVEADHAGRVEISELSGEQVDTAVQAIGFAPSALNRHQKELLRSPLNLVLLSSIADQADALSFGSTKDLLDAYWDRKRWDCNQRRQAQVRFNDTIGTLANEMSNRQRLVVPVSVLDDDDLLNDADVLASEHVLERDGQKLAFFHEAFFDYAFARHWVRRGQTLVQFLLSGEQELFRRGQVRQVLTHLRDEEPERFVAEAEVLLLNGGIRFHIQDVVLALLRELQTPTAAEWGMVEHVIASQPPFTDRLWSTLRTLPWFERLDAEGVIEQLLIGDDGDDQSHALEVMLGGAKERPDRMAQLLAPHTGRADFPDWLRWITQWADPHDSRPLFDLVLDAVRRGSYDGREHELWLSVHELGKRQPAWAVELLSVYLSERPGAFNLDSEGRVGALRSVESDAVELASLGAAGAPQEFCELLLPYMLRVMKLTEYDVERRPIRDQHFTYRDPDPGLHELEDALVHGAATALRKLVENDTEAIRPVLEDLAADPHDAAQWLLYEGLQAAGERYAEWAASLLLEGEHRFFSGYTSDSIWTTRQLLQVISPHVSPESFANLERAVITFRPTWEGRPAGRYSFSLLSAMDETRLSEPARRRLGELRRAFGAEQPSEPQGITGGFVGPPIPQEAAQHMSDAQWLRAIARHNTDTSDLATLRGGAPQLSQVLKAEAVADPARFTSLALRLTEEAHPSYGEAILLSLAETDEPIASDRVYEVIRHISSFENEEHDRWLGWPLRKHLDSDIPDDIIELILNRALNARDPEEDAWSRETPSGELYYGGDILMDGMNTARGASAEMLGDLLVHDPDGHRTALVVPSLNRLAEDPSVAVRACVGHLIAACLRHARAEAIDAFHRLIQTDDRLLATRHVENLIVYIGIGEPALIEPVVQRMLASSEAEVQKAGGRLAAYAGLELGLEHLLTSACESQDAAVREGAAELCALRLPHTANAAAASNALRRFANDDVKDVREAAAEIAGSLRGRKLRPFESILKTLIDSLAFTDAAPQLFITLERAPDRVKDLVLHAAQRFIEVNGADIGNIATRAAGDAREIGQLVLRAYAQAGDDAAARSVALDLIDGLLLDRGFGVDQLVEAAER